MAKILSKSPEDAFYWEMVSQIEGLNGLLLRFREYQICLSHVDDTASPGVTVSIVDRKIEIMKKIVATFNQGCSKTSRELKDLEMSLSGSQQTK